jgi:hypothetical protein
MKPKLASLAVADTALRASGAVIVAQSASSPAANGTANFTFPAIDFPVQRFPVWPALT